MENASGPSHNPVEKYSTYALAQSSEGIQETHGVEGFSFGSFPEVTTSH